VTLVLPALALLVAAFFIYSVGMAHGAGYAQHKAGILMGQIKGRPGGCGEVVWREMVALAIREKRIAKADAIAWTELSEDDRQIIEGAAHATLQILRAEMRKPASHPPPPDPPQINRPAMGST
jgi:hypothetical protein